MVLVGLTLGVTRPPQALTDANTNASGSPVASASSLRGVKHLDVRLDHGFVDDVEEEEHVRTRRGRRRCSGS
jgi:hypothetical protein